MLSISSHSSSTRNLHKDKGNLHKDKGNYHAWVARS